MPLIGSLSHKAAASLSAFAILSGTITTSGCDARGSRLTSLVVSVINRGSSQPKLYFMTGLKWTGFVCAGMPDHDPPAPRSQSPVPAVPAVP